MDSPNNFAAAYNLLPQRGSSSSASFSHLRPPPKRNAGSPVSSKLGTSANGSIAAPSVSTPPRVKAQSRGRQASASPDLFATSSRGGSHDSSGSQEDSIQQPNRFIPKNIQLSPDLEHDSDSNESARPAFNNSGPLFIEHNDDEDPLPSRLSASNYPSNLAGSSSRRQLDYPPSRSASNMRAPAAQGSFTNGNSNGRLVFQADDDDEDEDQDLWGGSVSPVATRPLPTKSTKSTRSKETRSSTNSKTSTSKQAGSRKLVRHDSPDPSAPFWIEIPPLSESIRRLYSFVELPSLRSQRAAAAGAEIKNKRLAELSSKPLVIEEQDEDDEEHGDDETQSIWFDPEKRKKSIAQKKRRADPTRRRERAQIRLSQQQQASDSDTDSSSSVSFERLKVDLSSFKTVPTRKWGTPGPEDASQGLRAAPKSTEGTPKTTAEASPRKTISPTKRAKPLVPEDKTYEAIFLASSTSDEDAEPLPPPSKTTKPVIANDKGKHSTAGRPSATASGRDPSSSRVSRSEPAASAQRRRAVNDESDDEFVPAQDPEDAGPTKPVPRNAVNGTGGSANAKMKAGLPSKAKPGPPPPAPSGPNGQRLYPKPAVAPLPSFRLKPEALVNMPAPTGRILDQKEYDKEDGRRTKAAGTNGKAAASNKKGPSTTAGQRRRARSRSNTPPEDRRRHRRARSDSDEDYEVQAVSSSRDPHRTPQSGSRPKARVFSSADRRRRSDSFSPPRRSGGSHRRQRDQSVTPSSDSEDERSRSSKRKMDDRRRSGGSSAVRSRAGPLSKTGASQTRSKDGPAPRSFVMPDSQPPQRRKLKTMTFNRDKILGKTEGRRSRENGEGRAPESRESRFANSGEIDYGHAGDDSDVQSDRQRRTHFSRSPSSIRTRRQAQEEGSDVEMTRKRAPKSLRSELNEEAWVYTSGTHKRDVYRDDLNKLRKARKTKGNGKQRSAAHDDSEDSESDSMAASTGESSLSSESKMKVRAPLMDFLVDDDDQPVNTLGRRVPRQFSQASRGPGESSRQTSQKNRSRRRREDDFDSDDGHRRDRRRDDRSHRRQDERDDHRRRRDDRNDDRDGQDMQPSDYARIHQEREAVQQEKITMELGEAYWWEFVWLVLVVIDRKLPPEDRRLASHARGMIRERMADGHRALQTMAIRKNFQWYLKTYPKMQRFTLTNEELYERIEKHGYGCGMCRRKKQKPESRICLYGKPYGPDLSIRQPDEISSSDCNTEQSQDYKTKFYDVLPNAGRGKKNYWGFYLGSSCAARAELMHNVIHWEVNAQEKVSRMILKPSEEQGWFDMPLEPLLQKVSAFATANVPELQRTCEHARTQAMDFDRNGG